MVILDQSKPILLILKAKKIDLISSWKCNYSIYLDIQLYHLDILAISTLVCLILGLDVLVPSIDLFSNNKTTLLKSDVSGHFKAYSSYSFQPTGIGLGSL